MTIHGPLQACIFDVDGVLLASPHERAWREALRGFAEPERFTTAMYQAVVAGKPRMSGARAALEALGVPDAAHQAVAYAEHKQKLTGRPDQARGRPRLPRRVALRPGVARPWMAHRRGVVVKERQRNDAVGPPGHRPGACSTFSAPMCADATCRAASPTRPFFFWRRRIWTFRRALLRCGGRTRRHRGRAGRQNGRARHRPQRRCGLPSRRRGGSGGDNFDEIAIDALADGRLCLRGQD